MKNTLQITFLLFSIICYSQNIKQIETELSYWKKGEEYGDKIKLAHKLQKLDPFNHKAINYICYYYQDRKIDSVNYFFDNLINDFPNKPEPYLLRSEFIYAQPRISNYPLKKIEYLLEAIKIDQKNVEGNYSLAEIYYRDFIKPFEKSKFDFFSENNLSIDSIFGKNTDSIRNIKLKSIFPNSAQLALQYFENLWEISTPHRKIIYYPIKQLECFLKIKLPSKYQPEKNVDKFYPINQFMNLSSNWECDLTMDYLFEIGSSEGTGNWLTKQLENLKEPNLFNLIDNTNSETYRFTWLRTFHHPIAVRVERIKDKYYIYWSIGKGAGGYNPKGIKRKGKKNISQKEWQNFEELINDGNYRNLPNEDYVPTTDGATWTLEYKSLNKFEAKNTNRPSEKFKSLCLYLIKLANIKIKDDDIY